MSAYKKHQIIEGLLDSETIQELLQVKDLTLDEAISKCRGLEAAKKSQWTYMDHWTSMSFRLNPLVSTLLLLALGVVTSSMKVVGRTALPISVLVDPRLVRNEQ